MTTIVNNPAPAAETGSGIGIILGLIFLAAVAFIFFVYGGFLMGLVGQSGVNGFNLYSMGVAVIGAIVVIYIARVLHISGRSERQ